MVSLQTYLERVAKKHGVFFLEYVLNAFAHDMMVYRRIPERVDFVGRGIYSTMEEHRRYCIAARNWPKRPNQLPLVDDFGEAYVSIMSSISQEVVLRYGAQRPEQEVIHQAIKAAERRFYSNLRLAINQWEVTKKRARGRRNRRLLRDAWRKGPTAVARRQSMYNKKRLAADNGWVRMRRKPRHEYIKNNYLDYDQVQRMCELAFDEAQHNYEH